MYCNQIFSILKKVVPVPKEPVIEIPEENSELISSEEPIEETPESETPTEEDPIEESPTYVVANIIVCDTYEIASRVARCEFGESALAIDTTLYPVAIGDTYRDGVFYDSLGNEIKRNLTESEQIEALILENKALNETINALLGLEV